MKSNLIIFVVGMLALVVIAAWAMYSRSMQPPDRPPIRVEQPAGKTATEPPAVLVTDSGRADGVSRDFTVPRGCERQQLTFEATLIDDSGSGGFVNFNIYTTDGAPGDNALGTYDLEQVKSGSGYWSVPPGDYYVEQTGHNADWRYEVRCR